MPWNGSRDAVLNSPPVECGGKCPYFCPLWHELYGCLVRSCPFLSSIVRDRGQACYLMLHYRFVGKTAHSTFSRAPTSQEPWLAPGDVGGAWGGVPGHLSFREVT